VVRAGGVLIDVGSRDDVERLVREASDSSTRSVIVSLFEPHCYRANIEEELATLGADLDKADEFAYVISRGTIMSVADLREAIDYLFPVAEAEDD
jgi:hypothetical protein